MLSERYLRKRYRDGFKEGFEKSFIRARDEMLDWFKRRDAAAAEGKPFNEPPPGGWEAFNRSRRKNSAKAQDLANVAANAVNGTRPSHLAELESWYIRKGLAEDMGVPFDEPHPIRSKRNANGNGNGSNGADAQAMPTAYYDTLADLVQWSVRKALAEERGKPFNEPHPIRSKLSGNTAA